MNYKLMKTTQGELSKRTQHMDTFSTIEDARESLAIITDELVGDWKNIDTATYRIPHNETIIRRTNGTSIRFYLEPVDTIKNLYDICRDRVTLDLMVAFMPSDIKRMMDKTSDEGTYRILHTVQKEITRLLLEANYDEAMTEQGIEIRTEGTERKEHINYILNSAVLTDDAMRIIERRIHDKYQGGTN